MSLSGSVTGKLVKLKPLLCYTSVQSLVCYSDYTTIVLGYPGWDYITLEVSSRGEQISSDTVYTYAAAKTLDLEYLQTQRSYSQNYTSYVQFDNGTNETNNLTVSYDV